MKHTCVLSCIIAFTKLELIYCNEFPQVSIWYCEESEMHPCESAEREEVFDDLRGIL
jgi:hypothetical protein